MSQHRRIYRTARSARTSRTITAFFDGLGKRVFLKPELTRLIKENREQWDVVDDASAEAVIDDLTPDLELAEVNSKGSMPFGDAWKIALQMADASE